MKEVERENKKILKSQNLRPNFAKEKRLLDAKTI
jgi:hypothetical protein